MRVLVVVTAVAAVLAAETAPVTGSSALAQTPSAPPLAAYARLPAANDAVVSPDGARVAYVETRGDKRTVRIRTFSGQVLAALNAGDRAVLFLEWAGPDHVLIVTRGPVGPFQTPVGEIPRQDMNVAVSYDLSTRASAGMLNNIPGLTGAISSYPRRIAFENRAAVMVTALNISKNGVGGFEYAPYRVDPRTGRGVQVGSGSLDVTHWLARPNGDLAARSVRRSNGDWLLQTRRGAGWAELARVPASVATPKLLGFGRDGRSLLVFGGPDGGNGLQEIAPDTGNWSAPLPEASFAPPTYFDRSGDGRVLAAFGPAFDAAPIIYDPALRTSWAVAGRSFPGKQLRLIDMADDRRTLILGVSEAGGPESTYVLDLDAKRADLVGEEYPDLPAEAVAPLREISFKAGDGTALEAVLTTPRGREPKGLPLVVLAQGLSRNEEPRFDWVAQALASRGYAVLQVDSRDSGPGRERAGDGQFGRKLQTDLSDAVRHLASTGLADLGRVCIVGLGDHGGYAALAGVTVEAAPYRCAVAVGARSDLRAELRSLKEAAGGSAEARYAAALRRLGVSGPGDDRLDPILPARQAARGRAPVMLLHAANDPSVPAADARSMQAALRRAGRTAELIVVPDADSGLTREAARLRVLAETLRFIQAHNPPA